MTDAAPSSRACSSAELDAVTAAQQWLAERGLVVPTDQTAPVVRSTHRRSARRSKPATAVPSDLEPAGSEPPNPDRAEQEAQARTVVLRKLSAQARTRGELEKVLRAKEVPAEIADQVLDRMEDVGLVDDAAFAHDWVHSRQQRRRMSRRALGRELRDRGVSQDQIDDALAVVGSDQEYASAVELAARRYRSMGELPREVARRRLAGALARRGFGSGLITRALAAVMDGAHAGGG